MDHLLSMEYIFIEKHPFLLDFRRNN